MYTVKIIANTVSENLERLIGFYIDEVQASIPGAVMTFQYQALNGINETIYSCMITVCTSIIDMHFAEKKPGASIAGS
jgi:hypothetical protein